MDYVCVFAGTPHKDTVCELCADGWFANISEKNAACVPHSACAADQLLLPGSGWHDNVCATCEQLEEKGTVKHTHIHSELQSLHVECCIHTFILWCFSSRLDGFIKAGSVQSGHSAQHSHPAFGTFSEPPSA